MKNVILNSIVEKNSYLFLFLISWLLTSCAPQPVQLTEILTTINPTLTPSVTHHPVPTLTATLAATKADQIIEVIEPTLKNEAEKFQLCSPLVMETIPELFEIVSDPYNPPPANRIEERHHGVDFSHYARKGLKSIEFEQVQSITSGVVAAVIIDRLPYGNMVIIESNYSDFPVELAQKIGLEPDSSLYFLYAHLAKKPLVVMQDKVSCGQLLGEVGKTGYNIVNPHLHLEIRIGPPGIVFEGMAFYTTTASLDEMKAYQRWRTSGEFQHIDPMHVFSEYLDWEKTNP